MKKLLTLPLLVGALGLSGSALGCQLTAWNGGTGGTPLAGGPELPSAPNADPNITRYSGECSMEADAGDYVQDNSPATEARMLALFYFFNDGASSGDLLVGYADEGGATPLFTVSFTSSDVSLASGAGSAVSTAIQSGWNSVEMEYNDGGAINLWLNSDATAGATPETATGGTGTVESVRLGLQNGTGVAILDNYEARRSTNIGRLRRGDAFADDAVDVLDLQAYVDEILNRSLISGTGVAQCTEDAAVDVLDIQCVVDTILGRI